MIRLLGVDSCFPFAAISVCDRDGDAGRLVRLKF